MNQHRIAGRLSRGVAGLIVVGCTTVASAQVADFALFGGAGVNLGQSTKVRSGATGSNGDVTTSSFNETHGLYGGGSLLLPSGGSLTYGGPIQFNGSATVSASPFTGGVVGPITVGGALTLNSNTTVNNNIVAGGDVTTSFSTVNGSIRTNGNYAATSSFDVVNGNVFASGNVTMNGDVFGNLTHGGTFSAGPFGSVSGTRTNAPNSTVVPSFATRTLPTATSFTSGGANVFSSDDIYLAPGSYGTLTTGVFTELFLTGGDYYFDSFNFSGWAIHLQNVSAANPVRVFVSGDLVTDTLTPMTINGLDLEDAAGNAPLADLVSWETHGDFIEADLGGNEWIGTIFAPFGDVSLGQYTDILGRVYAGGTITTRPGVTLNVVPEPALLGAVGLLTTLTRRRRV